MKNARPGRVLVTRRIPEAGLELLRTAGIEIDLHDSDRPIGRAELARRLPGKDGLLCLLSDRIDGELLDGAPSLRAIANYAVGFDNIDLAAAAERGIPVTNTPGVLTEATADLAWALLLSAARRVAEGDRLARSGEWDGWKPLELLGRDVHGAVLAVIGAGRIGAAVARRAFGFRMRVLYVDRQVRPDLEAELGARRVELAEALAEADFVSLHVPLIAETRHLLGARELASMKRSAVLVNTSRGPVIDEAALVEALKAGRPGAAGLDVYEREPAIPASLRALENVVLLPHLGSATVETRDAMARKAAENLLAALRGERPPDLVNEPRPRPA